MPGSRFLLHSMHCDSGTLCSLHHPSVSAAAPPNIAENLGSVQSVLCPHTARAASDRITVAVGTALFAPPSQSRARGRAAGCKASSGADEAVDGAALFL